MLTSRLCQTLLVVTTASLLPAACLISSQAGNHRVYDVVVYGGTPSGVMAAVAASRMGCSAIVLEPRQHIGGMMSGGLSRTDTGTHPQLIIGGLAREYFERSSAHYGDFSYNAEPHVAEQTFLDMLNEANVAYAVEARLRAVVNRGTEIKALVLTNGDRIEGRVFVDASYEGDLLALAGVSYRVGREDQKEFGEPHAGFQPGRLLERSPDFMSRYAGEYCHGTPARLSPYLTDTQLLPGIYINPAPWPPRGTGDKRIMGYCYRLCVTQDPDNRVPWPRPDDYDPNRYILLLRLIEAFPNIHFGRLVHLGDIGRNGKYDANNVGHIISMNHIGMNYRYPEADWDERARIEAAHRSWQQGFLWFLSHDRRVPEHLREQVSTWGLAKDEFVDNDHWPYHLYIREARRLVGEYIVTEHDVMEGREHPDVVARSTFIIDSHAVQRIVHPGEDPTDPSDDYVLDEGWFDIPHPPFDIPYRSLTPKRSECTNLLVSVCVSATHVGYGAIRLEPQYMMMGHAAGVAASLAIRQNAAVQDVPIAELHRVLKSQGAKLDPLPETVRGISPANLPGIVLDDSQADLQGPWVHSNAVGPFVGSHYIHDGNTAKGQCRATFRVKLPQTGRYEVRIAYTPGSNRASKVPVTIQHADGRTTRYINQKLAPSEDRVFESVGVYRFEADHPARVTITNQGTDGYVVVDAVQFLGPEPGSGQR